LILTDYYEQRHSRAQPIYIRGSAYTETLYTNICPGGGGGAGKANKASLFQGEAELEELSKKEA
jgi:hypothetical protein